MKLALGTVQFGMAYGVANIEGQVSQEEVKKILQFARKSGVDTIDTAIAYGDSEKYLGLAGVSNFKLITKLPSIPESVTNIEEWISKQVEVSLFRLGVENVYGLMLHQPDQLLGPKGKRIIQSLINLQKRSVVHKIGISVYSHKELQKLFELHDFEIVQCPFNLVDRGLVTSGWLSKLKMSGVEVHSRSSFLQGLLLMSRDLIPDKFQEWDALWAKWHDWLDDQSKLPLEACMSYVLSFSEIDRVIVGVESKQQLEQIVGVTLSSRISSFPHIYSENTNLINPANWNRL
jgi:aryl-alcohol dehydrogenase-like predicted oxidoreductase